MARAQAMPGVISVAGATETPLSDSYSNDNVLNDAASGSRPTTMNYVSSGYFTRCRPRCWLGGISLRRIRLRRRAWRL